MSKGAAISRTTAFHLNTRAISAIDEYFGGVPSVRIAGVEMTPAEVKAILQAEIDAIKAVDATRAILSGQIGTATRAAKSGHQLRQALRAFIIGTFGPKAVKMLLEFNFAVPKPKGPRKAEAKLRAVEGAGATRAARHTMGKRQKKAIKATSSASDTKKS